MFKDIYWNLALDNTKVLNNLLQYEWLVTPMRPLWNGFMRASHYRPCPSKTAIHLESMIDKPSSDYFIYLIISFVSDLARKCGHGPVLTFDQPLY